MRQTRKISFARPSRNFFRCDPMPHRIFGFAAGPIVPAFSFRCGSARPPQFPLNNASGWLFVGSILLLCRRCRTRRIQMRKKTARAKSLSTLSFTAAERCRIDRAAKLCGWKSDETASFARVQLLGNVAAILSSTKPPQPGTLLRSRLRSLRP